MTACAMEEGICLLEFSDSETLPAEINALAISLKTTVVEGENQHLTLLERELRDYFSGKLETFTVALCPEGTTFQKQVWNALKAIPYGKTISYKEQALALKSPESVRAVAAANGKNSLLILLPCHRIIGSQGGLTGYKGGLWRKQYLLELESKNKQLCFDY